MTPAFGVHAPDGLWFSKLHNGHPLFCSRIDAAARMAPAAARQLARQLRAHGIAHARAAALITPTARGQS